MVYNIQWQNQIILKNLPVANVTRSIFVIWTPSATSNSIHILIAFGRIFSKINPSSKHATYVGVSLIKTFVNDGIHKWGAYEKGSKILKIQYTEIFFFFCTFFLHIQGNQPPEAVTSDLLSQFAKYKGQQLISVHF